MGPGISLHCGLTSIVLAGLASFSGLLTPFASVSAFATFPADVAVRVDGGAEARRRTCGAVVRAETKVALVSVHAIGAFALPVLECQAKLRTLAIVSIATVLDRILLCRFRLLDLLLLLLLLLVLTLLLLLLLLLLLATTDPAAATTAGTTPTTALVASARGDIRKRVQVE